MPPLSTHYACLPIEIPADDPFFGKFGQRCMNFVRSILAPNHDCSLGYSQQVLLTQPCSKSQNSKKFKPSSIWLDFCQMNKLTHFIDSSSVYGSTPEQTSQLRGFRDGKLKVFDDFGRDLLPMSKDPNACLTMEQGSACFESGWFPPLLQRSRH